MSQLKLYEAFARAYRHFNKALFQNRLPDCVFVLQRRKSMSGYFIGSVWNQADGDQEMDEIAINPDRLSDRTPKQTLSTLVHEMCHLEQAHFGRPSKHGYHNAEWAKMMLNVGLEPIPIGEEKSPITKKKRRTGYSVTHSIIPDGPFDKAADRLLARGFKIPWTSIPLGRKRHSKTKYTCPECELSAWAKPGISLICGSCKRTMPAQPSEKSASK